MNDQIDFEHHREGTALPGSGPILGVWAHPDDEAFLSAALMAQAVLDGREVVVCTATKGEHGADPEIWPPDKLARLREQELLASLAALGVARHHWLGHADGSCAQVRISEGAAQVAELIGEVQPDVIVTFGPDGMTGHPDHQAVSAWTSDAMHLTSSDALLLHATKSRDFLSRFADLHEQFDVFFAGGPPWTPPHELALELVPTGDLLAAKMRALGAQASQTAGIIETVGEDRFAEWAAVEWFVDGR